MNTQFYFFIKGSAYTGHSVFVDWILFKWEPVGAER